MLSSRGRRQVGSVFTGLLLYQSLFMAVGACAQAHESDHAGGEHGIESMAGDVESHSSATANPSVDVAHADPTASSPHVAKPDGSKGCCAHHAMSDPAGSNGASDAVSHTAEEGPVSGGPDCTALSSCGTPAVDGAPGADGRLANGDSRSALRPASLVPAIVDLSITPPPPKA